MNRTRQLGAGPLLAGFVRLGGPCTAFMSGNTARLSGRVGDGAVRAPLLAGALARALAYGRLAPYALPTSVAPTGGRAVACAVFALRRRAATPEPPSARSRPDRVAVR